jgi:hypothetical protein
MKGERALKLMVIPYRSSEVESKIESSHLKEIVMLLEVHCT